MKKIKILFLNTGYCTGLDGSFKDYLMKGHRYLFCSKSIQKNVCKQLDELIKKNAPDICCFAEMKKWRENKNNQLALLVSKEYPYYDIENKYGKGLVSSIPLFRTLCNGVLSRRKLNFKKYYLRSGVKRLVYEIDLNGAFLFMVHLSLTRKTRKKQLTEIKELIKNKENAILCGDFNIYGGLKELDDLLEGTNLKIVNNENDKTFPSNNPSLTLDLFVCSNNIKVDNFSVLHYKVSDHLPIMIHISL